MTLLIWSMMFFALFGLTWLATILTDNGVVESTAVLAMSMSTLGGIWGLSDSVSRWTEAESASLRRFSDPLSSSCRS